jgi:flavin-dependent dehydrogenase
MRNDKPVNNKLLRREFIKLAGISSIATFVMPVSFISCNSQSVTSETVSFQDLYLPVIKKCDVIIVGGGFAGVSAAIELSRLGKSVVLVERRIFLGREITGTCRPWIISKGDSQENLPEIIKACIDPEIIQPSEGRIVFRFNKVKIALEDKLLQSGVDILYASQPVQLVTDQNKLNGLVIGNKSGRQVILAKMVLDCSESASVVRLAGIGFQNPSHEFSTFIRTLEYTQIKPLKDRFINVPESLKIKDNRVLIQQGYLGANHYYVECPMEFPNPVFDFMNTIKREKEAWKTSIAVAKFLYEEIPEFSDAFLTGSSLSLTGLYSGQMQKLPTDEIQNIHEENINAGNNLSVNNYSFATTYRNLWCINEASRLSPDLLKHLLTPQGASTISVAVSRWLNNNWEALAINKLRETININITSARTGKQIVKEQKSPQKGRNYEYLEVKKEEIPVIAEVDILVVGGGSSGATSAIVAAENGKSTMVVDMNPGFGGTGTFGGVNDYWGHGKYKGFTARHIKKLNEIHQYIPDYTKRYAAWIKPFITWNVQAKMFMLLNEIEKSGAKIIWNSIAIGTIVEDNKVLGAVFASPDGLFAVRARIVIDATGDGDIASFAGASYHYGSSRDSVPLHYALCAHQIPGIMRSSFRRIVDVTNVHDYTRAVTDGMHYGSELHDHFPYLASRETRHIQGEVVVTLTDHLKFRQWEDVINIHYSNCDIKGYHSSDWVRMGLIPPNMNIEMPFRAIVPKNIENILVVGKALSVNHESLAAVRMQPDMENLGGIGALAAVFALNTGVMPGRIDIKRFQQQLVKQDLLPSAILTREIKEHVYSKEEINELISKFNPEKSLQSYSDMEMGEFWTEKIPIVEVCTSLAEIAVPVLEKALAENSGKMAVRIAQALAMFGEKSAAQTLYNEIMHQLENNELPELLEPVKWGETQTPPDQAAMPHCANLIYSLGMTRSREIISVCEKVSEIFNPKSIDEFSTPRYGFFYYVDAVCYGAELLGNKNAISALKKLHNCEFLNNKSLKNGMDPGYIYERLALLELNLGRALTLSGSTDGVNILIGYIDDIRGIMAEFAHITLVKSTGKDFGKNKPEWQSWIQSVGSSFLPIPVKERIDG